MAINFVGRVYFGNIAGTADDLYKPNHLFPFKSKINAVLSPLFIRTLIIDIFSIQDRGEIYFGREFWSSYIYNKFYKLIPEN